MTPRVPIPSTKAFASLPRTQLEELHRRIEQALAVTTVSLHDRTDNRNQVGVRLTADEKIFLFELARLTRTTASQLVRNAIHAYLRQQDATIMAVIRTQQQTFSK